MVRLGDFELHVVSDGTFRLDGGQMFGIVPKTMWERLVEVDEKNRVKLALNCLLVVTPQHRVLIDSGIGNKFDAKWTAIYDVDRGEPLERSLAKVGYRPDDIDTVIHTHLHFDHAGGNTKRIGDGSIALAFPRAKFYAQRGEWEHAHRPFDRDRASYAAERALFLEPYCQYELLDGDVEVVPGIRVAVKRGHNRDMQVVLIESRDEKAVVFSDLCSTHLHLNDQWITSFDLYPLEVVENKKALIAQALREKWLCAFYHDRKIPLGYLREENGKITAEPVAA